LPTGFRALEFEPKIFPVDSDVVDHKEPMQNRIF